MPHLTYGNPFGGKIDLAEMADGTQGQIIYYGAAGAPARLNAGTSGQVLQTNGAAQNPSWATPAGDAIGWTFIEKLSPSAVGSINTTGTITVYDEYLAIINVNGSAAGNYVSVRINGDTAANYSSVYTSTNTVAHNASQDEVLVAGTETTITSFSTVRFQGKTRAVASGRLGIISDSQYSTYRGLGGAWTGGNATQITSITFRTGSGTITGTIEIYGRNYHA